MPETFTINFDGGSRGNPGPAGIGVVVSTADGTPVVTLGRYIGRATNNTAEYRALITGLEEALKLGAKSVVIRGDSELIVKQMRGEYRVKHPDLRPLYEQATDLMSQFTQATIEHTYREKNALADQLANLAMDRKADVTDVDEAPVDVPALPATKAGDRFVCVRCGCAIQVIKPTTIYPHQLKAFRCQCGNPMTN